MTARTVDYLLNTTFADGAPTTTNQDMRDFVESLADPVDFGTKALPRVHFVVEGASQSSDDPESVAFDSVYDHLGNSLTFDPLPDDSGLEWAPADLAHPTAYTRIRPSDGPVMYAFNFEATVRPDDTAVVLVFLKNGSWVNIMVQGVVEAFTPYTRTVYGSGACWLHPDNGDAFQVVASPLNEPTADPYVPLYSATLELARIA